MSLGGRHTRVHLTSLVTFLKFQIFFKKKFQKKRCRASYSLLLWGKNVYMSSGRKQKQLILVVVSGEENWLEGWHRREIYYIVSLIVLLEPPQIFFNLCTHALFKEKGRERETETKTEKVVLKVATVTN